MADKAVRSRGRSGRGDGGTPRPGDGGRRGGFVARAAARYAARLCALVAMLAPAGCIMLAPLPRAATSEQRLANFPASAPAPLHGRVDIHWDAYQIPFIVAEDDRDVPFAMGMVHAHLRLGQMEMLRRVSQGRLAEMFGPFVVGIDHSLRILNLAAAAEQIEANLPESTRQWLDRYLEGVNHFREHAPRAPAEQRLLALGDEPWTLRDIITMGRLMSADVNWIVWYQLLQMKDEPGFDELLGRLKAHGRSGEVSFGDDLPVQLMRMLTGASRSGSNAFAVGGARTASGAAILGADPHLGLDLPNIWVLLGYHSPGAAAVGMTYPGVPAVLVGRNRDIAWGATNMRSLNTTLFDVSALGEDAFTQREERIAVRWWFDRRVRIRQTPYGPLINDAPILSGLDIPPTAMRWRGHEPSDELTPFLQLARASSWEQFRQAFDSYAISGQNFLYADREGNVGQVLAVEYDPAAGRAAVDGLLADPNNPDHQWGGGIPSTKLPAAYNPDRGYIVTANNNPVRTDPPIALIVSANDRYRRISDLIEQKAPVAVADAQAIQRDVYSVASHEAAKALALRLAKLPEAARRHRGAAELIEAMAAWDGHYTADSRSAVAYQVFIHHLVRLHYGRRYGPRAAEHLLGAMMSHDLIREDVEAGRMDDDLAEALRRAARPFRRNGTWGAMHRLHLRHMLANVPVIGGRFRYGDYPAAGSSTTVAKTAHSLTDGRHPVSYGAQSRFVTDLSDPDENYFVLLGGQDGWFGSANFKDQWELWRRHEYIRLPLTVEAAAQRSVHQTTLRPGEK